MAKFLSLVLAFTMLVFVNSATVCKNYEQNTDYGVVITALKPMKKPPLAI